MVISLNLWTGCPVLFPSLAGFLSFHNSLIAALEAAANMLEFPFDHILDRLTSSDPSVNGFH